LPLESRRLVRVWRLGLRSSPPAQPDWPLCRLVRVCCSLVRGFLAGTPRGRWRFTHEPHYEVSFGMVWNGLGRSAMEWNMTCQEQTVCVASLWDCFANRSDVASVYVVLVVGQLRKFQSSLYMNACQSRAEMRRVAGNGGSQPRIHVI
jgi:hypothetical protein